MWEACNLFPTVGINVLISRSLIKNVNGTFWMHDQLRILGREIARDRSFKGPECYRFYEQKEAMNMLNIKRYIQEVMSLDTSMRLHFCLLKSKYIIYWLTLVLRYY